MVHTRPTPCTRRGPHAASQPRRPLPLPLPLLLPLLLAAAPAAALDNGRALTPPQGWSAWNSLVFHPTQSAVEAMMRGLAQPRGEALPGGKKSLVELGYVQANLDDAWQACGAGVNGSFHDAQARANTQHTRALPRL